MSIIDLISENVRQLEPYTLRTAAAKVKLNQNENPFDIPDEVKNEILEEFKKRSWNRYPEVLPFELIDLLSEHHHWPADGIIAANGSNELMYTVMMTLVSKGVKVVIPTPTFFLYEKAVRIMGGDVVHVMMKEDSRIRHREDSRCRPTGKPATRYPRVAEQPDGAIDITRRY